MTPNPKHQHEHRHQPDDQQEERQRQRQKQTKREPEKSLQSYIPPYLRPYVRPYHGDFCYTPIFETSIIAHLMMEGFLPIACPDFLLPKLHSQRCVIQPVTALHISKSVRKKAKRFTLTVNQNFEDVVTACQRQHGDHCWLYPALVKAFRNIHTQTCQGQGLGYQTTIDTTTTTTKTSVPVRLYSIEVWNLQTGSLAAGELGYTVGSIFTSLTGFAAEDSAGSVQLAALGKLLALHGFTVWDLGMEMEYKSALGSHLMPREEFVRTVHAVREQEDISLPTGQTLNCRDILDSVSTPVRNNNSTIALSSP